MHVEGDQGEALLVEGTPQLVDLAPVGQQLAHPQRVVVEVAAGVAVGRDVHVVQLHLAIADQAEAIAQVHLAGPDRFHLGAE